MVHLKRTLARAALFWSIGGVIAVSCALGTGITGYLGVTALSGTRAAFTTATGSLDAVRVEADLADSARTQDAAARRLIAAATTAPLDIDRSLFSARVASSAGPMDVESITRLPGRATLVGGAWPRGAAQASIEAAAASADHLAVGDTITLGSVPLTIAGIWRQSNPLSPLWFGDVLAQDGSDTAVAGDVGPLVVDESVWSGLGSTPTVRWTIVPHAASVVPGDLPSLEALGAVLTTRLADVPSISSTGVIVSGGLGDTATTARSALAAVGGVSPIPLLLVVVVSFVALFELIRLLGTVRAGETALMRSRGASAAFIAGSSAIEAAVFAIPAAALGSLIGAVVVAAATGIWPSAPALAIFPSAMVIVATGLATITAGMAARRALRRDSANDSGRARSVAAGGLVIVLVAAAAFSVWQFLLYGSLLVRQTSGEYAADPIAVLAAPLSLLALAMVALALFPAIARLLEIRAARDRGLVRVLSARQLSRRIVVFATPVLVLSLAVGNVVLAAGYSSTWGAATAATRSARIGADVRLDQTGEGVVDVGAVTSVRDVTAVTPVVSSDVTLGDDDVSLVAPGTASVDAGVALPRGAAKLSVTTTVRRASDDEVDVTAWLLDAHGVVTRVALTRVTARSHESAVHSGAVPAGSWRLVALDAVVPGSASGPYGDPVSFELALSDVEIDSAASAALTGWTVQPRLAVGATVQSTSEFGVSGSITDAAAVTVRFMSGAGSATAGPAPIPITISRALATHAGLVVGDPVSFAYVGEGREVAGRVAGIASAVRGMVGDYGARADLATLELQQLRVAPTVPAPNELWISTTSPSATVAALRQRFGASVAVASIDSDASTPVLASARVVLWTGAIGALVLAMVTVAAVAGAMIRARSAEIVVLTAVGLTAREQARARRSELAVIIGFAVVAGLAGGVAVSLLLVTGIARSTVLEPIPGFGAPLTFDAGGLLCCAIGSVVGAAAIVAGYGARVVRQVHSTATREEVR